MNQVPARIWFVVGAAALMVIGAFGPWARALIFNVSGVDGGDGWIVVGLGIVGLVWAYVYVTTGGRGRTLSMITAILAGLGGIAVFAIDGKDIFGAQTAGEDNELFGDVDLISPGWGIFFVGIGSAALVISALVALAMASTARGGIDSRTVDSGSPTSGEPDG